MRRAIIAIILPALALASDYRLIPSLGDARISPINGYTNLHHIEWRAYPPPGIHSGITVTAWVRISKFNNSQLTTSALWCPDPVQLLNPDLLQGAARDVNLATHSGTLTFTGISLPPYAAPETLIYWPNGVCTIAGESTHPITVIIGGNEIQLPAGAFNKNLIAGPSGNIVIAGSGTVNLGISRTPCHKFYSEIDGVTDSDRMGITPESTVTNEFAMCTWRWRCDAGTQIYRSDLGRLHAFDALAVTKTNGPCAGFHSQGIYKVGFIGLIAHPPFDCQLFDARTFPRWLSDTELERIHANGVQEIYRRGEATP